MALALAKTGILDELNIELLGTKLSSIEQAEDREKFKELCKKLGEPVPPSKTVNTVEDALAFGDEIGYPIIVDQHLQWVELVAESVIVMKN